MMELMKNKQFSSQQDEGSQAQADLLHNELVGEKKIMISGMENFVDVLEIVLMRKNVRGDTALHVAVRSKNSTIVNFILNKYALEKSKHEVLEDKEITKETNKYGDTPMHQAAVYSVVNEILTVDEDTQLPLCLGYFPLHAAQPYKDPGILPLLYMDHGHLKTPMDSDEARRKERCSKRMEELKNTQFSSQDAASQQGLLHKELVGKKKVMISEVYKAVEKGDVDNFVDVLKQQCAQRKLPLSDIFEHVTGTGDSLLHVAVALGKEHIAEIISHHFPELLTRRNVRGDTSLHVAVRSKNLTMINLILSEYASVKSKHDGMKDITREKNEQGDTPLHEAVHSGNFGVVEKILHADKDMVHYVNKSRCSPLFLAAASENLEILNLLLPNPFLGDKPLPLCFGNSPLHAAILKRNPALIEMILKKQPELVYLRDEDGNTSLHYAAYVGYVKGFHVLLKNSFTLEENKEGHLPIHLASKMGHVEVIEEFLQYEWSINSHVLNQKGQNILHVAANNGKSNVVQYLLRNPKIDQFTINQKDNDGNTPLHLASINLFPKVMYFITQDNRTKVNLSNNTGLTARDIVCLASKNQMTVRKFLANRVLKEAGVIVKVNNVLRYQYQQVSKTHLSLKDLINTFLVVATLMVTVTFAAAFTVPGGVYSSDDPNPKNRGMAIFAHKRLFWVFTIFNMIAMYSSVIACGLMLMALIFDQKLATRATILAMSCLVLAFLTVPVAFMAAVRLVVAKNSTLALVITIIGAIYIFLILGLLFGFFPVGIRIFPFRQVGKLVLWSLIVLIDYEDKPALSSSQKASNEKENYE
ncbi:hypothetical protein VNO78_06082 [Psophocarpus tetragonolobus]|uniref:PGG domain-containing protein n=1 Tax=Psophocarpus tetragonolobus TaxID=3891 RepID=A0AAN9XR59_PSOTE